MSQAEFKLGDVVRLRSIGPPMTVEDLRGDGAIGVVWFAGSDADGWSGPFRDAFLPEHLEAVVAHD